LTSLNSGPFIVPITLKVVGIARILTLAVVVKLDPNVVKQASV
jgi:hypothetical protein